MNPLDATRTVFYYSGKKQADVARMVGAKASTISHYCVGDHYPNIAMFAEICKVCGVSAIIKNGEVFLRLWIWGLNLRSAGKPRGRTSKW